MKSIHGREAYTKLEAKVDKQLRSAGRMRIRVEKNIRKTQTANFLDKCEKISLQYSHIIPKM